MKKIVKLFLPKKAINRINVARLLLDTMLVSFFSKTGFLSSIYYSLFSTKFYREHRASLLGRLQYYEALKKTGFSSALLRRNIHRLEKGLIMVPRRNVFAEAYIQETVTCFANASDAKTLCAEERSWAEDVLNKYFEVVNPTDKVKKAQQDFARFLKSQHATCIPYRHEELPDCPATYEQLLTLFKRRRSVRWFMDRPVDIDVIKQAVRAATLAPSACNRQPFRFLVVRDGKRATEVAKYAMGTAGFADNIPCIIAIVGDLSAYPAERDRHVIYIDGSLAAMQLMLAFETLGLSTCPINWPDIEEREKLLSKKLKLSFYERNIMLMAVGYARPDGGIPFSQKKGPDLLVEEVNI